MIAREQVLAQLSRLLHDGSLPRSACSAACIRTLRPLFDTRVVVEQRSGGGRRIMVQDTASLREFLNREFPNVSTGPEAGSRASGVARFRKSKSFASDSSEIVSI